MVQVKHVYKKNGSLVVYLTVFGFIIAIFISLSLWLFMNNGIWYGRERTTIVLNTKPILVISFNHDNVSLLGISIPADTLVEATYGYGSYRLGKIFALDKLEKKQGKLILSTLSQVFGAPVEGYIDFNSVEIGDEKEFTRENFNSQKWKLFNLKNVINSNLNILDLAQIFYFYSQGKGSQTTFINMTKSDVLLSIDSTDQSGYMAIDGEKIDNFLKDEFVENKISLENVKVEVFNNTNNAGLADKMARIVTNIGGHVINIANATLKTDGCRIYAQGVFNKLVTVRRISKFFSCEVVNDAYPASRADITILVGENFKIYSSPSSSATGSSSTTNSLGAKLSDLLVGFSPWRMLTSGALIAR